MAKLLVRLNDASEDEVADLCQLLQQNDIDYYQTDAGAWGFSVAGLWLKQKHQYQLAKQLVDTYQAQRSAQIRQEYQELKQQGMAPGLLDSFKQQPIRFIVFFLCVA